MQSTVEESRREGSWEGESAGMAGAGALKDLPEKQDPGSGQKNNATVRLLKKQREKKVKP